ncbi:PucR family transcriptional regulator [Pseudogracilibacillus auburnensis]|uniref:Purine catabolism regulator n=1 Tax=Pseudogracilibacillus auburnensis TaxID=1494959 RepID=A0A2V3W5E5_9BACI|nr:PucR family transcriptional regulator [Pseudogracilibacillus auburnensis]MBO1002161.1 PucR family transcriptional regulator [Pseudogracilibacillus auburnensis]PXW87485.1 purine catabolism regulator [Pseudogracilibacillus auburnensis]
MALLVRDILKRPFFENAKVLAGEKGLNRTIKWAHIVEIDRFGHLLNGKEVILTTGYGWANEEKKSLSYLQQLLEYNASALCVELVIHTKELPSKMVELAERHDFPIIVFTEEVRFIDITKDLHELLLGYNKDVWLKLESLYNQLNKELISNGSAGDFLRVLHKETEKQVALKFEEQYRFFPSPSTKQQHKLKNELEKNKNEQYHEQPIYLFGSKIASLYFVENKNMVTQFDELALKRCGEILGQYFWKNQQQKEANQMKKNDWILEAIAGSLSHKEIVSKIQQKTPGVLTKEAIIAVKPFHKSLLVNDKNSNSETVLMMLLRPVLLEFGFQLFTVRDYTRNNYIFLLINQQTDNLQKRLMQAIETINKNNNDPLILSELKWISFGKTISAYDQLRKSYDTALSTLNYQQNNEILKQPFYDTLAFYRLIDQMDDKDSLKEIIIDYLGPILTYDKEKRTELLKTLQVYLKNLGAKNETAEELHIVRQTLYHRLNRIESLLGHDFMSPKNRFMIEFSIHALKYVDI